MRALSVCILTVWAGCIKAPEIVMVDRATALEQQAGGSFEELEKQLVLRTITPGPAALTPNQLDELGMMPTALVDETEQTEADRVDALLKLRCIGESKDGLLVDTHDDCTGASDRLVAIALIDRTNRARLQLWQWMHGEQPDISMAELRKAWTSAHKLGVICRGWLQNDDGTWEPKKC